MSTDVTTPGELTSFGVATLFIDGKWEAADTGATFDVTDPATGTIIGQASDAGGAETDRAIAAASDAWPAWARETAYRRAEVLRAAHDLMVERAEDLAHLMTSEQGKPLRAARNEVRYAADFLA